MIKCEIELDLSWRKDCVLIENHDNITVVNFMINSTKLYVPVVTLSINYNIRSWENIKHRFKIRISWTKYTSEIKTNTKKQYIRLSYWFKKH